MGVEAKFQVIKERIRGMLKSKAKRKWLSLVRRRNELQAKMDKLEEEKDAFLLSVLAPYRPEEPSAEETFQFRVDDDGNIHQVHCECPPCQAELQSLPVTYVVEQMISQGIIDASEAADARKLASQQELEEAAAAKKRSLVH